jgi:hypothetical protein
MGPADRSRHMRASKAARAEATAAASARGQRPGPGGASSQPKRSCASHCAAAMRGWPPGDCACREDEVEGEGGRTAGRERLTPRSPHGPVHIKVIG